MPLFENHGSAGHVRLTTAIAAGTPIVASRIRGLEGYLHVIAQAVPPGDTAALRGAVNRFLADGDLARSAAAAARAAARSSTRAKYFASIRRNILMLD
jgi:glycosyltransferase involved in cell wall biosynthesis